MTAYDKLGRAVEVSQSQIYAYDSSAAARAVLHQQQAGAHRI
ncbi:hypothetical protein WJ968_20090 [Achromobacter xylosoxidans]